ncbi:hypothetical protein CHELA40_30090 [Chelatococcus asaccharovorans]|nr:hypothetical protein CHELA17_40325 [Chelatococcus asaccharovorans]CAH1687869.1 hypothetical protein CHELA40_30090 [Chelatococcus asaccharovorans]
MRPYGVSKCVGRYERARRLRSTIGSVFRYAVPTARADNDPIFALRAAALTAPQTKSWAALTDPKAFGALLRAIDGFEGQATTTAALKLLALLFPRLGELRAAHCPSSIWTRGVDRSGSPHEYALSPSRARAESGRCHSQGRTATHWPRHLCLSLDPLCPTSHVGKHIECGAPSFGLHQGRDDLARVPRACQFHA